MASPSVAITPIRVDARFMSQGVNNKQFIYRELLDEQYGGEIALIMDDTGRVKTVTLMSHGIDRLLKGLSDLKDLGPAIYSVTMVIHGTGDDVGTVQGHDAIVQVYRGKLQWYDPNGENDFVPADQVDDIVLTDWNITLGADKWYLSDITSGGICHLLSLMIAKRLATNPSRLTRRPSQRDMKGFAERVQYEIINPLADRGLISVVKLGLFNKPQFVPIRQPNFLDAWRR